jgi:tetratricopeptide (TPR) repeat protein
MKRSWMMTVFVACVIAITSARGAETWAELNAQVNKLYQAGKYGEAVPMAQKAVAVAKAEFGAESTAVATSLNNLAGLYYSQGNYAEAEPLYRRALAIREKALRYE